MSINSSTARVESAEVVWEVDFGFAGVTIDGFGVMKFRGRQTFSDGFSMQPDAQCLRYLENGGEARVAAFSESPI